MFLVSFCKIITKTSIGKIIAILIGYYEYKLKDNRYLTTILRVMREAGESMASR